MLFYIERGEVLKGIGFNLRSLFNTRISAMSKDIQNLQQLGLISKVCSELDNHLGFSDKTLAEYIIHIAGKHVEAGGFQKELSENGAEFPLSFAENLMRIITTLAKPIEKNTGKKGGVDSSSHGNSGEFSGLAGKNTAPVPLDDFFEHEPSKGAERERRDSAADGRHDQDRDRDRKDRDTNRDDYDRDRRRGRDRSRSRSRERGRGSRFSDRYDDHRDRYRDDRRRGGRSRSRSRSTDRRQQSFNRRDVEIFARPFRRFPYFPHSLPFVPLLREDFQLVRFSKYMLNFIIAT